MMLNTICKEVIITNLETRGKGVEHSPIRRITQVYDKDGTLIAENDPSPETFEFGSMVSFARWCIRNGLKDFKVSQAEVYRWLDEINNGCTSKDAR